MQLTIDPRALAKGIAQVIRAVPSRPTSPILANILFVAQDNQVILTAYDLSLGIQVVVPADVQKMGAIAIPARLFSEIINSITDDAIDISLTGQLVSIKGSGQFDIQGLDPSDFPDLPKMIDGQTMELSGEIVEGLASVIPFVSKDASKMILNGVYVEVKKNSIEFAATDGHRLSVVKFPVESNIEGSFVVPSEAAEDIRRLGAKGLTLSFNVVHVLASTDKATLISRLRDGQSRLDGQYPNYPKLIPGNFASEVLVNRKDFIGTLERVSIVANQYKGVVHLSFSENSLKVASEASGVGVANEAIAISYAGPPITIGVNCTYLVQGLKAMTGGEILFRFNSATSPIVISPLSGPKVTHLLMPVQVKS